MKDTTTFKQILLGPVGATNFLAAILFAVGVAVIMLWIRASKRDITGGKKPVNWSWSFYWKDNYKQIISTLALMLLCIRIAEHWMRGEWLIYISCGIGLLADQLALLVLKLKDRLFDVIKIRISNFGNGKQTVEMTKETTNPAPVVDITSTTDSNKTNTDVES